MLGLTRYRLRQRRPAEDVYDFLEPDSGRVVFVACPTAVVTAKRGPLGRILDYSSGFRLFQYCQMLVALIVFPFRLVGAILKLWPFRSPGTRPRLIVREPGDGGPVLTLEVSRGPHV